MKSYPGSSLPTRSGWSLRTPVSSTATTTPLLPVVMSHAACALIEATTLVGSTIVALVGGRRYHWPLAGVAVVCPAPYKGSLGVANARMRPSTTAYSTSLCTAIRSARSRELMPFALSTCERAPITRPLVRLKPSRADKACACCGRTLPTLADWARIRFESDLNLTMTRASVSTGSTAGDLRCGPRSAALAGPATMAQIEARASRKAVQARRQDC